MSSRYRHIMPNSQHPAIEASGVSADPLNGNLQHKKKRNPIRVACNACRQRKTQCDGKRDRCGSCIRRGCPCYYVSDNADDTPAAALKKLNKRLEENIKITTGFFDHLRTAEEGEALEAFYRMRRASTFEDLLAWFKTKQGTEQPASEISTPFQSRLESISSSSSTAPDIDGPGRDVSTKDPNFYNTCERLEEDPPTPLSQWVNNVVEGKEVSPPNGYWHGGFIDGKPSSDDNTSNASTSNSCIDPSLLYQ